MNVRLPRRRHQQGFTLIELMVVITIIAVLTAVAIPTFGVVQQMMKRTQSKTLCVSIATAITQYYTDYSVYPTPTGMTVPSGGDVTLATTPSVWFKLCSALNGNKNLESVTTDDSGVNTRNTPYLSVARRDIGTGGYVKDPLSLTNNSFNLKMDTSYDNVIEGVPNISTGLSPDINISGGVAIWSSAPTDKKKWVGNY